MAVVYMSHSEACQRALPGQYLAWRRSRCRERALPLRSPSACPSSEHSSWYIVVTQQILE